jgi:hypothetical protein
VSIVPSDPSVEEFQVWSRDKIPTANWDVIVAALLAATSALNNAVGRRIELAAETATPRKFVPVNGELLLIDDCVEITAVSNYGASVVSSQYQLEPLNGLSYSGEPRPYDTVRMIEGGVWTRRDRQATVTVTARWGWSAIPAPAIEARKIAAKAVLDGRDVRLGIAEFTAGGAVSEREAKVVRNFVHDYKGHRMIPWAGR